MLWASMLKRAQILVIGHNESGCTADHEKIAYETGANVAKLGATLITGGLGGVMQSSCKGANEAGGIAIGVLPHNKRGEENEFCNVVIPTGLGYARDFVNALSADAVIIIGGGAGTLSEMCAAYMYDRPMVAIRGTGGMADEYVGKYMDYRKKFLIRGADSPIVAVKTALKLCGHGV
ncbi:MAG: Rossmann fold nucleotide-binding protein [Cenarchaeum symbiont of Oopsacas minuta]|nr:Rossmann fold nucleotide-binding protein [Cenarchaeum symbiont of Oopsacas minuta]